VIVQRFEKFTGLKAERIELPKKTPAGNAGVLEGAKK
jgi:hypothetical protein